MSYVVEITATLNMTEADTVDRALADEDVIFYEMANDECIGYYNLTVQSESFKVSDILDSLSVEYSLTAF